MLVDETRRILEALGFLLGCATGRKHREARGAAGRGRPCQARPGPGRAHLFDAGTWETRLAMRLLFCPFSVIFLLPTALHFCQGEGAGEEEKPLAYLEMIGGRRYCRNTGEGGTFLLFPYCQGFFFFFVV